MQVPSGGVVSVPKIRQRHRVSVDGHPISGINGSRRAVIRHFASGVRAPAIVKIAKDPFAALGGLEIRDIFDCALEPR